MSERDVFLNSILDNPDDDTARLVYADWLEKNGDPQGEFIRIQMAPALGTQDNSCGPAQESREQILRQIHKDKWKQTVPAHWEAQYRYLAFVRGFVRLRMSVQEFLAFHEVLEQFPWLLDVEIIGLCADVNQGVGMILTEEESLRLASCPQLSRVTKMNFVARWAPGQPYPIGHAWGDLIARTVCLSPHVRHLDSLDLSALTDEGARHLVESPYLRQLRRLNINEYYHRVSHEWQSQLRTSFGESYIGPRPRPSAPSIAEPAAPDHLVPATKKGS
jgi:uncharacterized protein (TIGR02996 family)